MSFWLRVTTCVPGGTRFHRGRGFVNCIRGYSVDSGAADDEQFDFVGADAEISHHSCQFDGDSLSDECAPIRATHCWLAVLASVVQDNNGHQQVVSKCVG